MQAKPSRPALCRAGALLLAGLAAGCGSSEDKFPPPCPALSLLRDAGDLTRFDGNGHDVTNMVLQARISSIPANCETADPTKVRATVSVNADMVRGPAAKDATLRADYFIAVTEGTRVLQEQDFTLAASFPSNVNRTTVKGDAIELLLPVSKTKTAAAYQIFVGFRLSPDELAYNRAHRAP
jgi:hypothetical protein